MIVVLIIHGRSGYLGLQAWSTIKIKIKGQSGLPWIDSEVSDKSSDFMSSFKKYRNKPKYNLNS